MAVTLRKFSEYIERMLIYYLELKTSLILMWEKNTT